MNKMNKIVNYTKTHGKTIAISTVTGVLGIVCGVIGYKTYISKNYGTLIRLVDDYGSHANGETFCQELTTFLESATKSIYPCIPAPESDIRLDETVSEDLLGWLVKHGYNPDDKISSVLVGFKK